jgi:glycosyltransferase involved in cell wall biosynthesis
VSVVLPVFNQAAFCLKAIRSILAQSLEDLELIIVNDGSTDASGRIIEICARQDRRIRAIHRTNHGIAASLNLGLMLARSDIVARMDADDVSLPGRIAIQRAFLLAHPGVGVVGGQMQTIDRDGTLTGRMGYETGIEVLRRSVLGGNPIAHPAAMIRRRLAMQVGAYRRAFEYAEDYDLWLRVSEHADLANLPDDVVQYRYHDSNTTGRHYRRQELVAAAARLAARHRRAGKPDPFELIGRIDGSILDRLDLDDEERARMGALAAAADEEDRRLARRRP